MNPRMGPGWLKTFFSRTGLSPARRHPLAGVLALSLLLPLVVFAEPGPPAGPALISPPYPPRALQSGWQGTTVVSVHFNADGDVDACRVVKSSGNVYLDKNTVSFIRRHWSAAQYANKTFQVPIVYKSQAAAARLADTFGKTTLQEILIKEGFTYSRIITSASNTNQVVVVLNGIRLILTLDTGAETTVIRAEAARRAGLTMGKAFKVAGGGLTGAIKGVAGLAKVQSFQIADRELNPSPVEIENIQAGDADGLLGLPTLKANHAVIMVNPPALFLNPKQAPGPEFDLWLRERGCTNVPLTVNHMSYIAAARLDGVPAHLILDTGAEYSILNEAFVFRNNFDLSDGGMRLMGVNGNSDDADVVKFKDVSVGDFSLGAHEMTTDEAAMFKDKLGQTVDGLLGFDVLAGVMSVINTSTDQLYLRDK